MRLILLCAALISGSLAIQCHVSEGGPGFLPSSDDIQPCSSNSTYCFSESRNVTGKVEQRRFGCDAGVECKSGAGCTPSYFSSDIPAGKWEYYYYTCCCGTDGCNFDFNSGTGKMIFGVLIASICSILVV